MKKVSKDYGSIYLAAVIVVCLLVLAYTFIEGVVLNPHPHWDHYLFVGIMVTFCLSFAAGFIYMGWDEYKRINKK